MPMLISSETLSIETFNYAAAGFAMMAMMFVGIFFWGLVDYLKGGKHDER